MMLMMMLDVLILMDVMILGVVHGVTTTSVVPQVRVTMCLVIVAAGVQTVGWDVNVTQTRGHVLEFSSQN